MSVDQASPLGSLAGVRVLELTHYIAGPHCGQILADHGADVVKVEPPGGEPGRRAAPLHHGQSLYFLAQNRGKRSAVLDLRTRECRPVLDRLLSWADILLTNYAAGVPARLGFDYARAAGINPRLVMVHITGFGTAGPGVDYAAFDGIIQSWAGLAHLTGDLDGPPTVPGLYLADHLAAIYGALGAVLALRRREHTGRGELVDLSMLDTLVTMVAHHLAEARLTGRGPRRRGNGLPTVLSNVLPAADGHVYVAPVTDAMWASLVACMGRPGWATDVRFATPAGRLAQREEIERRIGEWTQTQTRQQVVRELQAAGIPCGSVNAVEDLLDDDILRERHMVHTVCAPDGQPVDVPGSPLARTPSPSSRCPELGEHTADVLRDIGIPEAHMNALLARQRLPHPGSAS